MSSAADLHRAFRRVLLLAMGASLCSSHAASALERPAALESFLQVTEAAAVPAGWTGSVETCTIGTESETSIQATATAVNGLRAFAGVQPVGFDSDLNRRALAAALMMRAGNALSHYPSPSWPCYSSEGADAASRSNLYLGRSGAAAMVGYVDDDGVPSLGHRRWLLDPRAGTFGTGSTGTTNALLVAGADAQSPLVPELVAWPPGGQVPWRWVFRDWSASISTSGTVDAGDASVTVTVDGQPRAVSGVSVLPESFGTGTALRWNVGLADGDRDTDRTITVEINNVLVDGVRRSYRYELVAFVAELPLTPVVAASRAGGVVSVGWEAAVERGVPVTGYRVSAVDRAGSVVYEGAVAADARATSFAYGGASRLSVSVTPLSRLGSPDASPVEVAAPASHEGNSTPQPGRRRAAPAMRVPRIVIVGRMLFVDARISPRANWESITVRLHTRGRTLVRRATVRHGRARFRVSLRYPFDRVRPLDVSVAYRGSAVLKPATRQYRFGG